jgi:hypothetical protein
VAILRNSVVLPRSWTHVESVLEWKRVHKDKTKEKILSSGSLGLGSYGIETQARSGL